MLMRQLEKEEQTSGKSHNGLVK